MTNENIKTYSNPDLLVGDGNKAKWNNPKYRREGFRNLHKINRYGFYLRSDQVLLLEKDINLKIENNNLLKKMTNHKSFCSVVFAKNNKIIYEKYAKDFSENQPHTIQSITKVFINLFIGELIDQGKIDLSKTVSFYLPEIGSGYANASIQNVLNMNIQNDYSENYNDPFTSSYLQEISLGWRLPKDNQKEIDSYTFLKKINALENKTLQNDTKKALYKSANSDVLGLIVEKISNKPLRQWLLDAIEAAGIENGLYMSTDRIGFPYISGGGHLTSKDLIRLGLLFLRKGQGVNKRKFGSRHFIDATLKNQGPKYLELHKEPNQKNTFVRYSNQTMTSGNWLGHGGYGGQYLLVNMKTGVVGTFFSVLETPSATDDEFKMNIVIMLEQISNNF